MYLVSGHPCGLSGKLKFNLGHNSLPCATSHVYCYTYDQPNGLPIEMLGIGRPSPTLPYKVLNCSQMSLSQYYRENVLGFLNY